MDLGSRDVAPRSRPDRPGSGSAPPRRWPSEGCAVAICGRSRDRLRRRRRTTRRRRGRHRGRPQPIPRRPSGSRPRRPSGWAARSTSSSPTPAARRPARRAPPTSTATAPRSTSTASPPIALANATVGPMRAGRAGGASSPSRRSAPANRSRTWPRRPRRGRRSTAYIKTLSLEVARRRRDGQHRPARLHDTDRIRSMGDGATDVARARDPRRAPRRPRRLRRGGRPSSARRRPNFVTGASIIVDGGASRGLQ